MNAIDDCRRLLPLPNALDNEQEILAYLVDGYSHPDELPLCGEDFYGVLNGKVFEALRSTRDPEELCRILHSQGCEGPIREDVDVLYRATPIMCPRRFEEAINRIQDCARLRRLLCVTSEVDARARLGLVNWADARAELLRAVG